MRRPSAKRLLADALDRADYDTAALILAAGSLEIILDNHAAQTAQEKALALRQYATAQLAPVRIRA